MAHVDHGKTTLADALLASNGLISPVASGQVRYLDFAPEEMKRMITMKVGADNCCVCIRVLKLELLFCGE